MFTICRDIEQIIGQNRALLHNAGVLDLMSGGGLCSFAALDAGAAYVVGRRSAAGSRSPSPSGPLPITAVPANSYRFVNMEIMPALYDTSPEAFDVIIGRGVLELARPARIFRTTALPATAARHTGHRSRRRKRAAHSLRRRDVARTAPAESNDRISHRRHAQP